MMAFRQYLANFNAPFLSWRLGATTTILVCWISFIALLFLNLEKFPSVENLGGYLGRLLIGFFVLVTAFSGIRIIMGSPSDLMRFAFLYSSLISWSFTALFVINLAPLALILAIISIATYGMQYPKARLWMAGIFLVIILIPIGRLQGASTAIFLGLALLIFLLASTRLLAIRETIISLLDRESITHRLAINQQDEQIKGQRELIADEQKQFDALKGEYETIKRHFLEASQNGEVFLKQPNLQTTGNAWLMEALAYFPADGGEVFFHRRLDGGPITLARANPPAYRQTTIPKVSKDRLTRAVLEPEIWNSFSQRHILLGYRDIDEYAFFIHLVTPKSTPEWQWDHLAWLQLISSAAGGIMSGHLVRQERDALRLQDRVLNQVTAEIYRSLDVRSVLNTTAQQIGKAVKSPRVRIRILPPEEGEGA